MRNASPVLNIIHRLDKESEQYQEEYARFVVSSTFGLFFDCID